MMRWTIAGLILLVLLSRSMAETNSPASTQPAGQSNSAPADATAAEITGSFNRFDSSSRIQSRKSPSAGRVLANGAKRFFQKLNPFAPLSANETARVEQPEKLGRAPERPWGSIDQWTSARSAFPSEVTHESRMGVISVECPASK
jgi:hypothetical protein